MIKIYFSLVSLVLASVTLAQNEDISLSSYVYDEDIKSVSFGSPNTVPVGDMTTTFTLKFDDMTGVERNFFYRIIHCDRDWQPSSLRENDYIDGFNDEPLRGLTYSLNTRFPYIHYNQSFPNRNTRFKVSGNYVVLIYEDSPDYPILTQRFVLCERSAGVNVEQIFASDVANIKHKQEFIVDVSQGDLKVRNPQDELLMVTYKNSDWGSARSAKPNFIANDKIRFNKLGELQYWGGIEYRFFDLRTLVQVGRGVDRINRTSSNIEAFLTPNTSWNENFYTTIADYNGGFYIDNVDGLPGLTVDGKPLFSESETRDINSDYILVNFELKSKVDLYNDENIHILGAFNHWQPTPENRMEWDAKERVYKKQLQLKQGYYNYNYTIVNNNGEIDECKIDGSWSETENNITAILYFKGINDLADRAVGFQLYNTTNKVKKF